MPARLRWSYPLDVPAALLDDELGLTVEGKRQVDARAEMKARELAPPFKLPDPRRWDGWRCEITDRIINLEKVERYRRAGRSDVPFMVRGELVRSDA